MLAGLIYYFEKAEGLSILQHQFFYAKISFLVILQIIFHQFRIKLDYQLSPKMDNYS